MTLLEAWAKLTVVTNSYETDGSFQVSRELVEAMKLCAEAARREAFQ